MSPASWFFNLSALAIFMGVLSVFGFRLSDCQMVVRRGNAPRSSAYQAGALLLSYRTHRKMADGVGIAPTQPCRLTRFSGPGHCCSANHPKWSGWQELHLRPPRSERGRLLLTLHPGKNGARGRSLAFILGVRSAVLCGLSYASVNGGNGRDCTFGLLHVGQTLCG